MSKTIKLFSIESMKIDKNTHLPFDPFVIFCLAQKIGETKDGFPLVSTKLMSESEIDLYVKLLKDDLDVAAILAKKELGKCKEKMRIFVGRNSKK